MGGVRRPKWGAREAQPERYPKSTPNTGHYRQTEAVSWAGMVILSR